MPLSEIQASSKQELISKIVKKEMESGKSQEQALAIAYAEAEKRGLKDAVTIGGHPIKTTGGQPIFDKNAWYTCPGCGDDFQPKSHSGSIISFGSSIHLKCPSCTFVFEASKYIPDAKSMQAIKGPDYEQFYCKRCDIISKEPICFMCGKSGLESVATLKGKGQWFADTTKLTFLRNLMDRKNMLKSIDAETYTLTIYSTGEYGKPEYEFEGLTKSEMMQKIEYYKKLGYIYETNTKRDVKRTLKDKNGDMYCKRCESSRIEDTGAGWKCKDCGNTTSFAKEGDTREGKNCSFWEPDDDGKKTDGCLSCKHYGGMESNEKTEKREPICRKGRNVKDSLTKYGQGFNKTPLAKTPYQSGFTCFGKVSCQSCRNVDYNGQKCNMTVSPLYGKPIGASDWCKYHFPTLHVVPLKKQ